MSVVKRLARWTGWCDPCETERLLVLTEAGPRGVRAWLSGVGYEDRTLTLTCVACGQYQLVPWDEPDLPEPVVTETVPPVVAIQLQGVRQVVVRPARVSASIPEPVRRLRDVSAPAPDSTLTLVSEGLDLLAVAG